MAKLKCNHCGHLNLVKSEFMTFCDSCGKKLNNNFQEWKKFNAGKSFSDYKIEINTPEEIVPKVKKNKLPGKNNIVLIIGIVVGCLLLGEAYYLGYTGLQQFNQVIEKRSEIVSQGEAINWRLMEDKTGNFQIRFPGNAQKDIQPQEMQGETIYIVSYILEADPKELGNHLYGITFLKYPANLINHSAMSASDLDEFFTTVISSSAGSVGGEVQSISEKVFKDFPGRIAQVSIQDGATQLIYWDILIDNTLYMLQAISPAEKIGNEAIDTFFNSFELLSN